MNYTKLFYWLTVADNAKSFFVVAIIIFSVIAIISTILYLVSLGDDTIDGSKEDQRRFTTMCRKWMWWSFPFLILFWSCYIFTPSKRDALLIVAGGQTMNFLSTDSVAKQIPHELSDFVVSELKNMAKDAKVELNINTQKERLIDKAKKMTADELIEEMKNNSEFRDVILNKKEE